MNEHTWLARWLPEIHGRCDALPVLELGCGTGDDTAVLVGSGLAVIAVDKSSEAVRQARARLPTTTFHCADMRTVFPVAKGGVKVIVASLSLHYFEWPETLAMVARARAWLAPGGLLLCRVNSVNDHHFGASGHPRIAENFYLVDGQPKRFFDRESVDALLADGWRIVSAEERVIHKYAEPKAVWEVVAERIR